MLIITANKNQALLLENATRWPEKKLITWQELLQKLGGQLPSAACLTEHSKINQYILHPIEQQIIWQHCIAQYQKETCSTIESLAKMAQEAWWLMQHWQITPIELQKAAQVNTLWFLQIAKIFCRYCEAHQCIDETALLQNSITAVQYHENDVLQSLSVEPGEEIIFYGFLKYTPLQEIFFQNLKKLPLIVTEMMRHQPLKLQAPKQYLHVFDDSKNELNAALDWALTQYHNNPKQNIGLIVPNLIIQRSFIESRLHREKIPSSSWVILNPPMLTEYSMIQTALSLLQANLNTKISLNELAALLRSPYFFATSPDTKIERALFLDQVRCLQVSLIHWDVLIQLALPWPNLQKQLTLLSAKPLVKKQSLSQWVVHWKNYLSNLEFPNSPLLNNTESALYQKLQQLFDEFSLLMPWDQTVTAINAIQSFKKLCQKTYWIFQQKFHASIRVMSPMDAMHADFDCCWLVAATQKNLPFTLAVNVLLDKKIQRKYAVWAVDQQAQDDLTLACYQQLIKISPVLMISYAKKHQEKIQHPALFCSQLELFPNHGKHIPIGKASSARSKSNERWPIEPWSDAQLPGGSSALKSQRLCSMQAFAKHRLKLATLAKPVLGFTAIERGIIVHRALQLVWQQLESQKNLLALTQSQLNQLIVAAVSSALKTVHTLRRKLLTKTLLQLETRYITSLLYDWLMLEITRPAFKILSLEQETTVLFAEKSWRLRADRIDQLEDGRLLLIDYKTGATSLNHWQLDVFTEPQLPLYLLTQLLNIDGIAFAEISTKRLRMIGLSATQIDLGALGLLKAVEEWDDSKLNWQNKLEQLVTDFTDSIVYLNPLEGNITCNRCNLQSFCRIKEYL